MGLFDMIRRIEERRDRGINKDESVVFYPSYGYRDSSGEWKLRVRGVIFEKRKFLRRLPDLLMHFADVTSLDELAERAAVDDDEAKDFFKERTAAFVVDGESREQFEVAVQTHRETIGKSDLHGYFDNLISLPTDLVAALQQKTQHPWVELSATSNNRSETFSGASQLLTPTGITVVSDIDDTIKHSHVPDTLQLLLNTLFRPFKIVSGMPEVYKGWQNRGATFVYLTNSPYQLFEPLRGYLQKFFPPGAYFMQPLDKEAIKRPITDLVAGDEGLGLQENPKKHNLIPILDRFKERKFILVGDDTEMDAQIYADLFLGRNFPQGLPPRSYEDRIEKIYIRKMPQSKAETRDAAVAALAEVDAKRQGVTLHFEHPHAIRDHSDSLFD